MSQFLPVTKKDMEDRGWDQVDFVYVTGDAYVDHSSFGTAIISRLLESRGYKVGIIPQPCPLPSYRGTVPIGSRGVVTVSVEKDADGNSRVEVAVPAGTDCVRDFSRISASR